MKKQNQASEARTAADVICDYLESLEIGKFKAHPKTRTLVAERIQSAIDAATAEVKKEGTEKDSGFADNTDAVHSNSREQTGDTEWLNWLELNCMRETANELEAIELNYSWQDKDFGCRFTPMVLTDDLGRTGKTLREAIDAQMRAQGSEVPTQKAPTDSAVQKGTASGLAPTDTRKEKENATCLAARVEPTKEEEKSL